MNELKQVDLMECFPDKTWEEFRTFPHGVDVSSLEDTEIKSLITLAGYWIQDFVDKPFLLQTWTDKRRGNGGNKFVLSHNPKNLIEIKEYVEVGDINVLTLADFMLHRELKMVEYTDANFSSMYQYGVKYRVGETVLPEKVKMALFLTMADFVNTRDYSGMSSVKLDTIMVKFRAESDPIPLRAQALLKKWVDKSFVM